MSLSLDGARERLISQHHAIIECVTAAWTYRYTNGYTVTLRGPLTAHVVLVPNSTRSQGVPTQPSQPFSLKFESLDFGANFHDKSISLESIMGHRNPESSPPKTPHTRNAPTPNANGATSLISEDDKKWEEPRVTIERASIPGEPVNAFGIPQATMRCLEVRCALTSVSLKLSRTLILVGRKCGTDVRSYRLC
jgi:LIM-domain binding protein